MPTKPETMVGNSIAMASAKGRPQPSQGSLDPKVLIVMFAVTENSSCPDSLGMRNSCGFQCRDEARSRASAN